MALASAASRRQALIGAGVLGVGLAMAWGARSIPSAAGYSGVGPNFLPWLVAAVLFVCGGWLIWEAASGGFREMEPPSGAERGDWLALGWVSAGILLDAALITRIGFVFACALCFAMAVRGLRRGEGRTAGGVRQTMVDAVIGLAIAAPVYWMFTKLLGINLPGITGSGWL